MGSSVLDAGGLRRGHDPGPAVVGGQISHSRLHRRGLGPGGRGPHHRDVVLAEHDREVGGGVGLVAEDGLTHAERVAQLLGDGGRGLVVVDELGGGLAELPGVPHHVDLGAGSGEQDGGGHAVVELAGAVEHPEAGTFAGSALGERDDGGDGLQDGVGVGRELLEAAAVGGGGRHREGLGEEAVGAHLGEEAAEADVGGHGQRARALLPHGRDPALPEGLDRIIRARSLSRSPLPEM